MDKLERRKVQLDNQPVDFTGFLADLENLSGLLAQPKGLQFIMEPQTPLPQQIVTDGTRLRQILWNLIGNAVKFTQQGQIVVRVRREAQRSWCSKWKTRAWASRRTSRTRSSPCITR